jgi:protein-S-isoprenylcysteine O-methyltransferase Ste14
MTLAPASHLWPILSQVLFAVGGFGAVIGMLFLGKSFAVFPAVRTVVANGPYRLIRHPIYLCELVMIAGACLTFSSWTNGLLFAVAIVTIVIRIVLEEKVLSTSAGYATFSRTVRWRLLPGIW